MSLKSDLGDGTFRNPIIYGDYSDPDAIRVGDDYYMVSSSISNAPALPVLHSNDLVNWQVVNYVCRDIPEYRYINPIHGSGVWAPAIRYHNGEYYVYFSMPDEGIYVSKTKDPRGEWNKPVNILPQAGVIDPCPFWDDDGKAYMVTAVSGARVGYKSVIKLAEMSSDGMVIKESKIIYDGRNTENETIEGPKMYKRNGWYYIFAPAGGVKCGFQVVLRSRNINGPYESRVVMRQGNSIVNGPHQGAWVDTVTGEDWFIHFQDIYAAGRIIHLQPMIWKEDWPIIGKVIEGQNYGEPVAICEKPKVNKRFAEIKPYAPKDSDEFEDDKLGLQWQWNANYDDSWYEMKPQESVVQLNSVKVNKLRALCDYRNLLLQKWPAPNFSCETKMDIEGLESGDMTGIVSMGQTFAGLAVKRLISEDGKSEFQLVKITGKQEFDQNLAFSESEEQIMPIDTDKIKDADYNLVFKYQVRVREYVDYIDRKDWQGKDVWVKHIPKEDIIMHLEIGGQVIEGSKIVIDAMAGRWVGVKNGVFCVHTGEAQALGYVKVDYVRYTE